MRLLFALSAVLGLSVILTPVAAAENIVSDGGFEAPCGGNEFWTFYGGETFGEWTIGNHSVDVLNNPVYWQPAEGEQFVDLDGVERGSIRQTLATVPGQQYDLRFAMAGNPGVSWWPTTVRDMDLWWGGSVVDTLTFDTAGHTRLDMGWEGRAFVVTATSASTELKFESRTEGPYGMTIDNVRVTPVPEPTTWILLAIGAGLLLCKRLV